MSQPQEDKVANEMLIRTLLAFNSGLLEGGDAVGAAARFERVLEKEAANMPPSLAADARWQLAQCYILMRQYDKAVEQLKLVVEGANSPEKRFTRSIGHAQFTLGLLKALIDNDNVAAAQHLGAALDDYCSTLSERMNYQTDSERLWSYDRRRDRLSGYVTAAVNAGIGNSSQGAVDEVYDRVLTWKGLVYAEQLQPLSWIAPNVCRKWQY